MMRYELTPVYDSRKSFYKKAFVEYEGNSRKLYSYEHLVMEVKDGEVINYNGPMYNSMTTRRHKREFLRQEGINPAQYV